MFRFTKQSFSKRGTNMTKISIEQMLMYCHKMLPKNGKKGNYGAIYFYDADELGWIDGYISTGVIGFDYDWISKETADIIFNNFSKLVKYMPSLYAIQYSSSYYINPKKNGLHIYIKTDKLNEYEFNYYATLAIHIFTALIKKHLGIDLRKENPHKDVIDYHNCKITQRFHLFYSEFKYNKDAVIFDEDSISSKDIEILMNVYEFQLPDKDKGKNVRYISPSFGKYRALSNNKIKIDRNFSIAKMSGNDIRWRISVIADILFGDKAKEWCDNNFYYEDNKSIYSHYSNKEKFCDLIVKKWLEDNGYIEVERKNEIKTYISEFHEDIIKEIKKHDKIGIEAPTGSGKTYWINSLLAQETNGIVIVPFNVTNKLYDKCVEVNSSYRGDIPKNRPVVMVWDQAIKHWEQIKGRYMIIDESHQLFTDRTYRESAVKLVVKLKQKKGVCFVSATPAGEFKWVDKVLKYYKNRDLVTFNAKFVTNVDWSEYWFIKNAVDNNWYDKIVLFDDVNAGRIYEKFVKEGYGSLISYIRANRKDTDDFIRLRDNELLDKKITICTCIAFNGLNFKNTNENILVVGSIQLGETTSCPLIQQIGRIRWSNVRGQYFFNNSIYDTDIDDNIERNKEKLKVLLDGCSEIYVDKNWLDEDYIAAYKEIEDYYSENADLDSIITGLNSAGYIKGGIDLNCDEVEKSRIGREIKKKQSDDMKDDIKNDEYLMKEYKGEYDEKWDKKIAKLISNESYEGIDLEFLKNYVEVIAKNKLIEAALNDIEMIIRSVDCSDDYIKELNERKDEWMSMLSSDLDKKQLASKIKTITKYHKKYKDIVKIIDNKISFADVVVDVIAEEEERIKRQVEIGKITGAKSSPRKKCIVTKLFHRPEKYVLSIGQEFESGESMALYTGKSTKTISQWREKGWIA